MFVSESSPFSKILNFSIWLIIAAFLLLIVSLILSGYRKSSVRRRGQMDETSLQRWRTLLVQIVGESSQTQGIGVILRGFWKDSSLTKPQRYVILSDLLERQVLYPVYSSDGVSKFFETIWWNWLHMPVGRVRLSDMHWQKLASGGSASYVANGGDVILIKESPGAGVMTRSPNATQTISHKSSQVITSELVNAVCTALRSDAEALRPGHPLREQAESYADSLQRDIAMDRKESIKRTIGEVLAFAANSAGLWASTLAIIGGR